jgi:hypothetical protein
MTKNNSFHGKEWVGLTPAEAQAKLSKIAQDGYQGNVNAHGGLPGHESIDVAANYGAIREVGKGLLGGEEGIYGKGGGWQIEDDLEIGDAGKHIGVGRMRHVATKLLKKAGVPDGLAKMAGDTMGREGLKGKRKMISRYQAQRDDWHYIENGGKEPHTLETVWHAGHPEDPYKNWQQERAQAAEDKYNKELAEALGQKSPSGGGGVFNSICSFFSGGGGYDVGGGGGKGGGKGGRGGNSNEQCCQCG